MVDSKDHYLASIPKKKQFRTVSSPHNHVVFIIWFLVYIL
jgi:hypothetical protein